MTKEKKIIPSLIWAQNGKKQRKMRQSHGEEEGWKLQTNWEMVDRSQYGMKRAVILHDLHGWWGGVGGGGGIQCEAGRSGRGNESESCGKIRLSRLKHETDLKWDWQWETGWVKNRKVERQPGCGGIKTTESRVEKRKVTGHVLIVISLKAEQIIPQEDGRTPGWCWNHMFSLMHHSRVS